MCREKDGKLLVRWEASGMGLEEDVRDTCRIVVEGWGLGLRTEGSTSSTKFSKLMSWWANLVRAFDTLFGCISITVMSIEWR